jgi:hypothetical protein
MELSDDKLAKGFLSDRSDRSVPFEVKVFCAVSLLLSWPLSMLYFLYHKPSVYYWFGRLEVIIATGVCIWLLIMYIGFVFKFIGKGTAVVCLLVLPCTALTITSELQEVQFQFISSALLSSDCSASDQKVQIQQAWFEAKTTATICYRALMNITGSSMAELKELPNLESCPGYYQAIQGHEKEFLYLKGLERSYQCGGWCFPDYPVWTSSKTVLDSCALAAGHAMQNSIAHMGAQVSVYCFIILISVSLWLLLAPKWLNDETVF